MEMVSDINLLLKGKELLGVSHRHICKKWPALVRCIPCGREAVAGSIECKGTSFIRNFQLFYRKSA